MHDKVVRSEYSDIWHVLWPGFEITMNNTKKKHYQVMKENCTKMDRKQCTFMLVCDNLSFHCAFWCNKQYFFQLSKQCVWLRAIMPLDMVSCSLLNIVRLRISAQKIVLISFRVARTYVSVSDKRVSHGFLMRLTIGLILTCA